MYLRLWVLFLLFWVTGGAGPNPKTLVMRRINLIVIHCTGTREDRRLTESMLEEYHRWLGFDGCGYHYYIRRDGRVIPMRPLGKAGAHARGYNSFSIGIAYEGGLDSLGNPADTRTSFQRVSLQWLVSSLLQDFPDSKVVGHRDLSPDLNGNGVIEPEEWIKQCPCFDVKTAL